MVRIVRNGIKLWIGFEAERVKAIVEVQASAMTVNYKGPKRMDVTALANLDDEESDVSSSLTPEIDTGEGAMRFGRLRLSHVCASQCLASKNKRKRRRSTPVSFVGW